MEGGPLQTYEQAKELLGAGSAIESIPIFEECLATLSRKDGARLRALCLLGLGQAQLSSGHLSKADKNLSSAAESLRKQDRDEKQQLALFDTHLALSQLYWRFSQAKPSQVGEARKARLRLRRAYELVPAGKEDFEITWLFRANNFSNHAVALGEDSWAEEILEQVVRQIKRSRYAWKHELAQTLRQMAAIKINRSEWEAAEPLLEQAVALLNESSDGRINPSIGLVLGELARIYHELGKLRKAEKLHRQSLTIFQMTAGPNSDRALSAMSNLAGVLKDKKQFQQAIALYETVSRSCEDTFGSDHPELARALHRTAKCLMDDRRFEKADPILQKALTIQTKWAGRQTASVAHLLNDLGSLSCAKNNFRSAERYFGEALDISKRLGLDDTLEQASSLSGLSQVAFVKRHYEESERLLKKALTIKERVLGKDHPALIDTLKKLSGVYERLSKREKAAIYYNRASALESKMEQLCLSEN